MDDKVRYRTNMVKIPTPEFYVFYNGTTKLPKEQELRLSDAFESPGGRDFLELKVKVININPDQKHELLDKCHTLREYSQFVEITRKYKKEKESLKKAIQECIEKGILADYLKGRGSEVVNMLLAEYNYETDIQVKQEEAWADGWKEGMQKGKQEGKQEGRQEGRQYTLTLMKKIAQDVKTDPAVSNEELARKAGCTVSEATEIRKVLGTE